MVTGQRIAARLAGDGVPTPALSQLPETMASRPPESHRPESLGGPGHGLLAVVLPGAEDADEGGVHDADGESGESGGLVGQVSATSARCRD